MIAGTVTSTCRVDARRHKITDVTRAERRHRAEAGAGTGRSRVTEPVPVRTAPMLAVVSLTRERAARHAPSAVDAGRVDDEVGGGLREAVLVVDLADPVELGRPSAANAFPQLVQVEDLVVRR